MTNSSPQLRELVIISGKGGTGKTSITASFAMLAENKVIVDCGVDAADLHLILSPKIIEKNFLKSGKEASIREVDCINCGICKDNCKFNAVKVSYDKKKNRNLYLVDPISCEGCGVCVRFCPVKAIDFEERLAGEWYVSSTHFGSMIHAKLEIAGENSGKLIATIRNKSKKIAAEKNINLIIIDGPPGIGCPVIASITGTSTVLIVTEPTVSGLHDLERTIELVEHFKIPCLICINKFDINFDLTKKIEELANLKNIPVVGRIPYDKLVTIAQINGKSIVEYPESIAGENIKTLWKKVEENINLTKNNVKNT